MVHLDPKPACRPRFDRGPLVEDERADNNSSPYEWKSQQGAMVMSWQSACWIPSPSLEQRTNSAPANESVLFIRQPIDIRVEFVGNGAYGYKTTYKYEVVADARAKMLRALDHPSLLGIEGLFLSILGLQS